MGSMTVITDYQICDNEFIHHSAGLVRTARKLAAGQVFIPGKIWDGDAG
jgi:2-methylaconitate cis-trans-isomerase PrpF